MTCPEYLVTFCAVRDAAPRDEAAFLRARTKVVLANRGLVFMLARKAAPVKKMTLDDCAQAGYLGMLRALEDFDPSRGFALGTYVRWWAMAFINQAAAAELLVHVPVRNRERHCRIHRAEGRILTALGRPPTDEELTAEARVTTADLRVERKTCWTRPVDLDSTAHRSGPSYAGKSTDETLKDRLVDRALERADDALIRFEREGLAWKILECLSLRDRDIVVRRFADDETLEEIGHRYGLSRERVRQLQNRALEKMRRAANGRNER